MEAAIATPPRQVAAHYTLYERLGGGGQGEVWRAHDARFGIDVALKILRAAPGRSDAAWEALLHEHESASRLDHPHVLKVFTPEREDGMFLLPMELARGGDLRRLRGGDYFQIVPVLIQVAQALQHAHERGVIHRDLKPGNVLFDEHRGVKLADFGVSGRAPDPGTDALIRGLSPFTASPEQLRGEPPSPADDVYGLGALAYELLSGHPPHYPNFDAWRVQQEPAPPLAPTLPIPQQLARLIARMLAKTASDRPASMSEVIDALEVTLNETLTFDVGTAGPPRSEPPAKLTADRAEPIRPARREPVALAAVSATPPPPVRPPLPAAPPTIAPPAVGVRPALRAKTLERGELDGPALWEEVREAPLSVNTRIEPMRAGPPRALLLLVGLAAAGFAAFTWLPNYVNPDVVSRLWHTAPPSAAPGATAADTTAPAAGVAPATGSPPPTANAPSTAKAARTETAPPAASAHTRAGLARTRAAADSEGYATAAGEGYAALGAGKLDEARAAFERARALRPDDAEAADGLRRVDEAAGGRNPAGTPGDTRARAEALESQERWDEALRVYEGLLRQDRSLTFARAGKERAADRLLLGESLQELIDRPDRLSNSAQVRKQAAAVLQVALEQPDPGPVLRGQIDHLSALLPGFDKPVHLSLVSDNLTQVAIPSIGSFGSFTRHELDLKPGRYTVIGTRQGYRDVHRDITVSPGQENVTVNVSCDEGS